MPAAQNTKLKAVTLDHPINTASRHEWVEVTPEIAADYLSHNHNNRNLRNVKVQQYARDIRAGHWLPTAETIKFDWTGRLIDGQHRLEAIIAAETAINVLVVWGLDPETQKVLDVGAKRSASDALRFAGIDSNVNELAAVARIATSYEIGELRTVTSNRTVALTNSEVLDWVEHHPEVHNAVALARRVYKGIGGTPSAIAFAVMKLEEIDGMDAVEFFTSTAEFRTAGANDPRATLLRTFSRLKEQRTHLTAALQLSLIFRAWNAWRKGKSVSSLPIHSGATSSSGGPRGVAIPKPV